MKKKLSSLLTFVLTFFLGYSSVGFYLQSATKTSLETVTSQIEFYDGKTITTETYLWMDRFDGNDFMLGEPHEKNELDTFIEFENLSFETLLLNWGLQKSWSPNRFKRVKVIVTGKVYDNCNKGITCCLGEHMTIFANNIVVIGEIEDYSVPDKFRMDQ